MRFIGSTANEARFRAIAEENLPHIARYLVSLGISAADREDALQDVLLVLAAKLDTVEVGMERPFLFATARRIAGNTRRTARRHLRKIDALMRADSGQAPSLEELTDQLHLRARLDDAIDALPVDTLLVFVLHEVDEM